VEGIFSEYFAQKQSVSKKKILQDNIEKVSFVAEIFRPIDLIFLTV
jgi:predicted DsbA family dithiol-disulfide isomerase